MKVSQQDIVVEARELFRAQGYAGASMQDLANRVGLKKASLYSRFADKEALVDEVLRLTLDEIRAAAEGASDWRSAYEATLRALAETLVERRRCVGLHLAYGASAATPRALLAVRGFFVACRRQLAGALASALDAEEADQIAADALCRIEGATLWLVLDDDANAMRRALQGLLAEADALRPG